MQVTISVDDGCDLDYRLAKLFEKYNVSAIFYWPVDIQLLAIQKGWKALTPEHEQYISENFEIGSHTITHRYLTQIPHDEAVTEITSSKQILEDKYDQNITKFCYPRGYSTPKIAEAVKNAGYSSARSTSIGHIGRPDDPFMAGTAVHMGCPVRPEYEGSNWVEYGRKMFRNAQLRDWDFEAFCHSWEIERYNEWANVEKFIKEIARG
jgi:peptidoglycan/xylan/chitin deacetylase (PgdA/CDA1 family)